jgi:hypothetical protein
MLGGFLHICTCTYTIYCGLWPPDNTSRIFINMVSEPRLGFLLAHLRLVRVHLHRRSGRRRSSSPATAAAAHLPVCRHSSSRNRAHRPVPIHHPGSPSTWTGSRRPISDSCGWSATTPAGFAAARASRPERQRAVLTHEPARPSPRVLSASAPCAPTNPAAPSTGPRQACS